MTPGTLPAERVPAWASAPWGYRAAITLVCVGVLIALKYFYYATLIDATRMTGDVSPWFFAGWECIPSTLAGAGIVGATLFIGFSTGRRVPVLAIVTAYLVASLAHVLSGTWSVWSIRTYGLPDTHAPIMLSLNLAGIGGTTGAVLDRLSVDALIQFGLYGFLVGRLHALRRNWWVYACLYGVWIGTALVWTRLTVSTLR